MNTNTNTNTNTVRMYLMGLVPEWTKMIVIFETTDLLESVREDLDYFLLLHNVIVDHFKRHPIDNDGNPVKPEEYYVLLTHEEHVFRKDPPVVAALSNMVLPIYHAVESNTNRHGILIEMTTPMSD